MNHAYEANIGKTIRRYREAKKLTQEQLSAKMQLCGCDITRSAVAKIEVGQRHIYLDELYLFHSILSIPFEVLFEQGPEQE